MNRLNKKILIVFFLLAIFFLAVGVWYSPIIFKGYPTQSISQDILLARNYHKTGILASQNNQNVIISSSLINKEGHPLVMFQNLRSFFYAKIFDIVGVPSFNNLILISIILYALVLVIFVILTLYLFNLKIAIVFSLIYIFSPLGWGLAYNLGLYEFCLIFWALFFIFYFLGVKKTEKSQNKLNNLFFIFSGIFLAFSAMSKEVTLVFAAAFFIFLLIKKFKQQLIYVFIPLVILLMIFWLPSIFSGKNIYTSLFSNRAAEESVFSVYLHVFPDPYTYYFEKEEFLKEFKNQDLGITENLETQKALTNMGLDKIGLGDRLKVGSFILLKNIFRFFSLEDFGGPFIALLLILGLIYLGHKYRYLCGLFLCWLIISLFVLSFILLLGRSHLMDFIWPLILLITLGLFYLFQVIRDYFKLKGKIAMFLGILTIGLVLYHLVLVDHVVLGERYDKDFIPRSINYAQAIKNLEIKDEDIIAIPEDFPYQETTLNYLTDKSFVIFKSSTIEKLLKEEKIKQAFVAFGVKYILGYSDELSNSILIQTKVINISSASLTIDMGKISEDKSFFMNLVR